jgi:hypothetical protein
MLHIATRCPASSSGAMQCCSSGDSLVWHLAVHTCCSIPLLTALVLQTASSACMKPAARQLLRQYAVVPAADVCMLPVYPSSLRLYCSVRPDSHCVLLQHLTVKVCVCCAMCRQSNPLLLTALLLQEGPSQQLGCIRCWLLAGAGTREGGGVP